MGGNPGNVNTFVIIYASFLRISTLFKITWRLGESNLVTRPCCGGEAKFTPKVSDTRRMSRWQEYRSTIGAFSRYLARSQRGQISRCHSRGETLVHPPVPFPGWLAEDRRSRIVFIVREIGQEAIERQFTVFCAQSR